MQRNVLDDEGFKEGFKLVDHVRFVGCCGKADERGLKLQDREGSRGHKNGRQAGAESKVDGQ